jgi:hypothetical protein
MLAGQQGRDPVLHCMEASDNRSVSSAMRRRDARAAYSWPEQASASL